MYYIYIYYVLVLEYGTGSSTVHDWHYDDRCECAWRRLKALHFCYGVGAFVSPMIAEPFLLNEDCSPFVDNDTSGTLTAAEELRLLAPPGTILLNDTNLPADTLVEAQQMTRVRFAFWIMAAVQVTIDASLSQNSLFSAGQWRQRPSRRREKF